MQITTRDLPLTAASNPFLSQNYEYTGAYYNNTADVIYFVDKPNSTVVTIHFAKRFMNSEVPGVEVLATTGYASGISDSTLLKMLAISQRPELIKEIV